MLKELRAKITADASRFKSACDESIAKTKALAKALAEKATGARASERMVQQALERSERQMDKATAAAKRAKAAGGGGSFNVGNVMSAFTGMFTAQAAMAAIRQSINMTIGYISKMADKMDEIGKGAANLGTGTSYFQKLQFAAERTGTGFEKVFQGFSKTKKMAADAASGNAQATQTFHTLGISVAEIKTLSPEALFDRVAAALRNMDDPLQRDAIASRLFGEEFSKLNNFLKDYISLGKEAEAKGLIIKDEEIKAAEALKDSITNLQRALTSLSANTGVISFLQKFGQELENVNAGFIARKNLPEAMDKIGAKEDKEPLWKRTIRTALNSPVTTYGYGTFWGDKEGLGTKLIPRPTIRTDAITQGDKDKHLKNLQQQREEEAAKKEQEEEKKRVLEREKRAADDKKYQQGLQQLQASRQQPGGSGSKRGTQMLRSGDGLSELRKMGKDQYFKATGELLPPGAASDLQYIKAGLQLFDQLEQAQQRRAQTHKRISDAIAQQGASDEQRERMQLQRELDEFAAAGASKEALARLYATRIADITRKAQDRRHAQEMAQLRAENNRLIQQIDQRNKALQARLSGFKFTLDEGFDPNESAKSRRNRAKQQKLDESIAQKTERQERGENVHYSRAELRRIEEYERIRRRMGKNEQRMVALREEPEALQQRQERQQQRRQQPAPAPRQRQADRPQQPTRPATPQQRQWQQPRQPRLIVETPTVKPNQVAAPVAVPVAEVPVAPVKPQQVQVSPIPPVNIPGMMGAMGAINQTAYMPVLTQIASAVYKLGQHTYVVRGG